MLPVVFEMRLFEGLALERNPRPTHRLEYLRHGGKGEGTGIREHNQANELSSTPFTIPQNTIILHVAVNVTSKV